MSDPSRDMLVPNRLLFRFEIPIRYRSAPRIDGTLDGWGDEYLLPDFAPLDGQGGFGRIWLAWNVSGLFLACRVEGRRSPLQCDPKQFWKGDNLRLMTDMRDARDIRRASRYCQQFYFLPAGGGPDGRTPVAGSARIHRATAHAPPVPSELIRIAGGLHGDGYTIEAHLPAEALAGFDPAEHSRIGLTTMLEDRDFGQHYLTVGDELNWHIDPSMWATGVLLKPDA
jgi:hypothetical protein